METPILTSSFREFPQPTTYPLGNGRFRLTAPYTYCFEDISGWIMKVTAPTGFIFDMASIPRPLWSILGITPDGLHRAAALVHDFLTYYAGKLPFGAVKVFANGIWQDYVKPFTR